jgi:hypothetical protein
MELFYRPRDIGFQRSGQFIELIYGNEGDDAHEHAENHKQVDEF